MELAGIYSNWLEVLERVGWQAARGGDAAVEGKEWKTTWSLSMVRQAAAGWDCREPVLKTTPASCPAGGHRQPDGPANSR